MANRKNTAIIITVLVLLICIIIIKLIRIIIHRYYSTTTTTTSPPPLHIIHSPQQIHHHSLRFLFQNYQISPQTPHNQMNQVLINSLPTFKFDSITGIRQSTATATLDCAICITKFEEQDELRLLPNCSHVFHSGCIDQWILLSNHNCPICRSDVNGGDDGNELKMMFSNSSRSFRVEIGSVSLSRRIDDEISISANDLQNRSYSLGSFEYWIQDFDAEVLVELERRNENPAQSDDVSISVDDGDGGMDEVGGGGGATEVVIENRSEPDEVESCVRSLSHTLQLSNRFYGGNERRTGGDGGGGMDEGGGGRVWDLEGNQFGGQISEFFGFLSRV